MNTENNTGNNTAVSKGIKWGPFTARLPLLHMRIEWPELAQGLVVAASTSLALVPLLTMAFGLTFEEAITISISTAFLFLPMLYSSVNPLRPGGSHLPFPYRWPLYLEIMKRQLNVFR